MGKLRHIAFISQEPKKLSDFYQKHFGFEECKVFPSGSRMVIDPLFNLAFLQSRGDQAGPVAGTHRADGAELERQPGIHHYGFLVDDLNEAVAKLPASLNRGASPQVSAGVGGLGGGTAGGNAICRSVGKQCRSFGARLSRQGREKDPRRATARGASPRSGRGVRVLSTAVRS